MTTLTTQATAPTSSVTPAAARLEVPAARGVADPSLCNHPLWGDPDGLPCLRPAGHTGGHVYHDPTGSEVDDRHLDGGHG